MKFSHLLAAGPLAAVAFALAACGNNPNGLAEGAGVGDVPAETSSAPDLDDMDLVFTTRPDGTVVVSDANAPEVSGEESKVSTADIDTDPARLALARATAEPITDWQEVSDKYR